MVHTEESPLAGKVVKIKDNVTHPQFNLAGMDYRVEDWWDRVSGGSWMYANGNPACLIYAIRSAVQTPPLPVDDKVLYGKVDGLGVLLHESEIAEE